MENEGLVDYIAIRDMAYGIYDLEKEKVALGEDISQIRSEMAKVLDNKGLVKYVMIIANKKAYKEREIESLNLVSEILGVPVMTENYMPDEVTDPKVLEVRKELNNLITRYTHLKDEQAIINSNIRDAYFQVKNKGISVPCMKKLIDFMLHPDKLYNYRNDTPLLEMYVENVLPENS